jgi:hypothetical protein
VLGGAPLSAVLRDLLLGTRSKTHWKSPDFLLHTALTAAVHCFC